MTVILLVSIIALVLTYLDKRGFLKKGLFYAFVLLSFIEAIHYNYGNDYMAYYNWFYEVIKYRFSFKGILNRDYFIDAEPGWVLLNYLFKPVGFLGLVAVLSVIQNAIYYKFIKEYVPKKWMVLAMFIYLFDANSFYVINMSMLRQGFTVALFLLMFMLLQKKKYVYAGIIAVMGYLIHSSFLICLPFALAFYIPEKWIKYYSYGLIFLFLLMMINAQFLMDTLNQLMMFEQLGEYAENYTERGEFRGYGLGFMIGCIPLVVSIIYLATSIDSVEKKRIVAVSSISFMVLPFVQILPLAQRMGIYFATFSFAALPYVFSWIKNTTVRVGVVSLYVIYILFGYWAFFTGPTYSKSYSVFHSIFSVL